MKIRAVTVAAILAVAATATLAQDAGDAAEEIDAVVAIVNGELVRASEVMLLYESLGPQVSQIAFSTLYPQLLESTIERKVVTQRARAEGLLEDPEVAGKIAFWTERVLEETFINRSVEAALTEELIRAAYELVLADQTIVEEVRASHILLETQAEAYEAIVRIEAGEPFADLARELSIGPSGAEGGDLDFFRYEDVVQEFSDIAFSLAVGEYTTEPVETSFGWHIILATDRRSVEPPTFDEMFGELRLQEGERTVGELYQGLMTDVVVQRFNFDGSKAGDDGPIVVQGPLPPLVAPEAGFEPPAGGAPADAAPVDGAPAPVR